MKIIIGGDLVPTKNNEKIFSSGKLVNSLDKKITNIWFDSDYRVFNLECVLGEENELKPISKNGPNLIAPSSVIKGIIELKPSLLCLANNHIMDFGNKGLDSTLNILKVNHMNYTGIINNIKEEILSPIFEEDSLRVGLYNLCENEFSVATRNNRGANCWHLNKNLNEIKSLKEKVDHLIVIFHGGKEFYRYPSPSQQELAHLIIDSGADFLVYQHTHCIGCEEIYKGRTIVYGQGNFIFQGGKDEYWNSELLIQLDITKEKIIVKYHPIEVCDNFIKYSNNENILNDFYYRTEKIKDNHFIENEYNKYSINFLYNYLYNLHGMSFFNRVMHKLKFKKYFIKKYNLKTLLAIENIVECEAHRELLINGIKELKKQKKGYNDFK